MAGRTESLDSRVARVEEAVAGFKEDRIEARQDRKDIISRLDQMSQTLQSTSTAVTHLSLEKCGERLDGHDHRLEALELRCQNLPQIETEVLFWRRVLGGGFQAMWKIAAVVLSSGAVGGAIVKFVWPH